MSDEDLQVELERLKKENEALKAQAKAKPGQFSLKVSQKGAVSVYGMGRFPVTLYQEQWATLLDHADEIREFIAANESGLKKKETWTVQAIEGWKSMHLFDALRVLFAGLTFVALASAPPAYADGPSPKSGWLSGTTEQRFDKVARRLRGFDVAMAEVGYRYQELSWALHDENWGYAEYQAKKIGLAIENGIERRPARAASARRLLLDQSLPALQQAIAAHDATLAGKKFVAVTARCNACHAAEEVGFIHVRPPTERASAVGPTPEGG